MLIISGEAFEKAGVNISVVHGDMNPDQIKSMRSRGKTIGENQNKFFATGVCKLFFITSGAILFYVNKDTIN